MKDCDAYADATNGAELLGLQDVLKRMESELAQLRTAAWSQHQAQTQIRSVRFRTKAERAAVSVVLSDLHFKVHLGCCRPVHRVLSCASLFFCFCFCFCFCLCSSDI